MEEEIGIYKITSPLGCVYIGQSVNISKRFIQHKKDSKKRKYKLYNSFNKYGFENHTFEVLELCSVDLLNEKERYYQELYNVLGKKGLNLRYTKTSDKSGFLSCETKEKLRKKDISYMYGNNFRSGIQHTKEIKDKIRNTLISNAKKPDYKNAMTGRKGDLNPFFGKKHSLETRLKQSLRLKGSRNLVKYNEDRKCPIIDITTGIFFESINEASLCMGVKKSSLKAMLSGKYNNKTNLIKI